MGPTWNKSNFINKTEIVFVKELPADLTYSEKWDASEAQDGSITAAVNGTTVYISSNGAEKIMANKDSTRAFANFGWVRHIKNMDMLYVFGSTNIEEMFSNCNNLIELDLSSFDTTRLNFYYNVFRGCNNLQKITVGDKVGTNLLRELPTPSSGKWYAESNGLGYTVSELPGNKADTYYASQELLPHQSLAQDVINGVNNENSNDLEKADDTTNSNNANEVSDADNDANQNEENTTSTGQIDISQSTNTQGENPGFNKNKNISDY